MSEPSTTGIDRYGALWPAGTSDLTIEMQSIQLGGSWNNGASGAGLFHHYKSMQRILWPHLEHHRWSDLILKEILANRYTCLLGAASTGKTHCAARFAMCDYFCFPWETTILVSSTELRGLRLRIWAELKMLLNQAKEVQPDLPGIPLEASHSITTDDAYGDASARDFRNGLICIPCMSSSGTWTGLSKYSGVKNKRVMLVADELQFMREGFLQSIANLDKNIHFRCIMLGNPIEPFDQLGMAAEPKDGGWDRQVEPTKTITWETKFRNGIAINLVGTDSPNFDYPQDKPPRFPYLISAETMKNTAEFYGVNSLTYYSQCMGVMKTGMVANRVLSVEMCRQFHALEEAIWGTDVKRTRVYAIDAAYGGIGGDRCVGGWGEFGLDAQGKLIFRVNPPIIIPVSVKNEEIPEDQIARYVMEDCEKNGIPAKNVFFDATGRGSLGTSFARIWSAGVNPVEFGGAPSKRPVTADLAIWDAKERVRRSKLCDEHYSKFVTEMWFSVRYMVEAAQLRGMTMEVAREFALREWRIVRGDKIELETKSDTKKRMGRSPDLADWMATLCEGARRLGFKINKLANEESRQDHSAFLAGLKKKSDSLNRKYALTVEA